MIRLSTVSITVLVSSCFLVACGLDPEPDPELRMMVFVRPTKFSPDYLTVQQGDRVVVTDTLDWGPGTIHDTDLTSARSLVQFCYVGGIRYGGILDCAELDPPVGYVPIHEEDLEWMFPDLSSCAESKGASVKNPTIAVKDCISLQIFVRGNGPDLEYGWEPGWNYQVLGCGGSTWISWSVGRIGPKHPLLTDTLHLTMLPC